MKPLACAEQTFANIGSLIFTSLIFLVTIAFAFDFIRKWLQISKQQKAQGNNDRTSPLFVYSGILGIIFGLLSIVSVFGLNITCFYNNREWYNYSAVSYFLLFSMLAAMILLIFDIRLYTVFYGTAFGYSRKIFIFLGIIYIIWIICGVWVMIAAMTWHVTRLVLFPLWVILYVFQTCTTVGLFVRGLFKV